MVLIAMIYDFTDSDLFIEKVIDIVFLVTYILFTLFFIAASYKTVKYEENRTLHNWSTIVCILLMLMSKNYAIYNKHSQGGDINIHIA